jgi:hypothetical protein
LTFHLATDLQVVTDLQEDGRCLRHSGRSSRKDQWQNWGVSTHSSSGTAGTGISVELLANLAKHSVSSLETAPIRCYFRQGLLSDTDSHSSVEGND